MATGCREPRTAKTFHRVATGMRRVTAVAVTVGVLAWAVLPAYTFALGSDTGTTTCRMACADTPDCCCKPALTAGAPRNDRFSGAELSAPAARESCPRDCATLTVVPGTSTARWTNGVHRLSAPGADQILHTYETYAAIHQGRFDVARPRGPPAQEREDLSPARVSPNTPGACASLLGKSLANACAGTGSSESRHSSVRHPSQASFNQREPRVSDLSTTLASHRSKEPIGVDADQHGGTHE